MNGSRRSTNSWIRNLGTGSSEQDLTGADMTSRRTSFAVHCRKHDSDDEADVDTGGGDRPAVSAQGAYDAPPHTPSRLEMGHTRVHSLTSMSNVPLPKKNKQFSGYRHCIRHGASANGSNSTESDFAQNKAIFCWKLQQKYQSQALIIIAFAYCTVSGRRPTGYCIHVCMVYAI